MSQGQCSRSSSSGHDPVRALSHMRRVLREYLDQQPAISYLQSLCALATNINASIENLQTYLHHKNTLERLSERICELVYLLVCTCNDIDCNNPEERVFISNYMKHAGEDFMQILKNIQTFISAQGGAFGMVRYNIYGYYHDGSTIGNYMVSLYTALQPFYPPPEEDISKSAQMLASMSMGEPRARDRFRTSPRQSTQAQPNITFHVYYYIGSNSRCN